MGTPPQYSLRAHSWEGNPLDRGILPAWSTMKWTVIHNAWGVLEFEYAIRGENVDLLVPEARVAVYDEAGELPNCRFVIGDINGNTVSKDGELYKKYTAKSIYSRLATAVVRIAGDYNKPKADGLIFKNATPGKILDDCLDQCYARGELQFINWDFNATTTSGGGAWNEDDIDITMPWGWSILQILQWLTDKGYIDHRFNGDVLQVYNAGGLGNDRTTGSSPTVFWAGDSMQEIPVQANTEELYTGILVKGKENRLWYYEDSAAVTTWKRRVGVHSDDNIEKATGAAKVANRMLGTNKDPSYTVNAKFTVSGESPKPLRGFDTGDKVWLDFGGAVSSYTVVQVDIETSAANEDQNGVCTLTLGSRFKTLKQKTHNAIAAVTGTGASSVSSGAPPARPPKRDLILPAQPLAPVITTNELVIGESNTFARFVAEWNPVILNEDGDPLGTPIDHYEFHWRYTTAITEQPVVKTPNLKTFVSNVLPGQSITCWIVAVDKFNNASLPSVDTIFTTGSDTTPPPVPSTPVASSRLGTVSVYWDGTFVAAAARPIDFKHVEVHRSDTVGFTPSASTLVRTVTDRSRIVFNDVAYNVPVYFKLISVDRSNNKSAASAEASVTTSPLVNTDIIGEIISGANIVDGSIIASEKIQALSITAAEIAALSITSGKIAANAITADKIDVGAVDAEHIAAGAIHAEEIAVGAITADRMAIGITTNIIKDPSNIDTTFRAARIAALPARWTIDGPSADVNIAGAYYWNVAGIAGGAATQIYLDNEVPCDPGKAVRCAAWVNKDALAAGTGFKLVARFKKADGTYVFNGTNVDILLADIPSGWFYYEGTVTAPAAAVACQMKYEITGLTAGNIQIAIPEMAVLWGVIQSFDYVQDEVGWAFRSGSTSQVEDLKVLDSIGADTISANSTISIGGRDLETEILDNYSRGVVAYATASGWTVDSANITTTETIVSEFNVGEVQGGRTHIILLNLTISSTALGSCWVRIRFTTDNTTVTTSSATVSGGVAEVHFATASEHSLYMQIPTENITTNPWRFAVSIVRRTGTGTYKAMLANSSPGYQHKWALIDLGTNADNSGTISQKSKSSGSADAGGKTTYTRTWWADWSRSFESDGSARSPDTNDLYQGYYSSTHGNTKSMCGFDDAAIRSALSGATIKKVEITYRIKHSYQNAGLRVRIGTHNIDNRPSTFSNVTTEVYDSGSANKKEGSTYTSSLPTSVGSALRDNSIKGFTFGPGADSSNVWYGYVYGYGSGNAPRITITYEK